VKKVADLHIHTCFSDGLDTPEEVVQISVKKGLACVAITDHDSVEGVRPAMNAAMGTGLEVVCGVELSTEWSSSDIHILGYFIDLDHPALKRALERFCSVRIQRVRDIVENLQRGGYPDITFDEVRKLSKTDAIGRPHIARILIQKGYAADINDAFARFLGEECSFYVPKFKQSPYEAIELIRSSGGAAVMAHPMKTLKDELIPSFVEAGLAGLETYYLGNSISETRFYEKLARKHGLVATGGSDAHGRARDYSLIGQATVDYAAVEELRSRCG